MRRDLDAFRESFDVVIVGAGIHGACIARLLAMHGLKVALIERGDFGGATSRNCAKLLHGGFRYVQHLDVPRIRESMQAQRDWLRAAPHLVRPLRFVIPTYGYGTRGTLALAAGMLAFHVIAWDRNRGLSSETRLPHSGVMSRSKLLGSYPQLARGDVAGGAWWYDAQILDASRLALECVAEASRNGAAVANHLECVGLRRTAGGIAGVLTRDRLSGREFEIDARLTINAAGPWSDDVSGPSASGSRSQPKLRWTRNINLVTSPLLEGNEAVGVASGRSSDARIGRSKRLFFVSPWQDCAVIGTSHEPYEGPADALEVPEQEISQFVAEINEALPGSGLASDSIRSVHVGLTPAEDERSERAKRSLLIDHAPQGHDGLISAVGIKYTTAPAVARKVVELVRRRMALSPARGSFAQPLGGAPESPVLEYSTQPTRWAARVYGARYEEMLRSHSARGLTEEEHVFRCRVMYGIRAEMVMTLGDAVFRATDHAERGRLNAAQLQWCADALSGEHQWSPQRLQQELAGVKASLQRARARVASPEFLSESDSILHRNASS
jgi:glycerol-3-phosphate dehydrogenase